MTDTDTIDFINILDDLLVAYQGRDRIFAFTYEIPRLYAEDIVLQMRRVYPDCKMVVTPLPNRDDLVVIRIGRDPRPWAGCTRH